MDCIFFCFCFFGLASFVSLGLLACLLACLPAWLFVVWCFVFLRVSGVASVFVFGIFGWFDWLVYGFFLRLK